VRIGGKSAMAVGGIDAPGRKLPQRGPGQSLGRKWIYANMHISGQKEAT